MVLGTDGTVNVMANAVFSYAAMPVAVSDRPDTVISSAWAH